MTSPKIKAILPDPVRLYTAGLRTLADVCALVHVARCGLVGSTRMGMLAVLGIPYETLRYATDTLDNLGLIAASGRDTGIGSPRRYVCTVKGWRLLTDPVDLSLYPHAQLPLAAPANETKKLPLSPAV